jgi:catechol 2,3-dioxygenase-like lactoylglutathione lyase family enzyme
MSTNADDLLTSYDQGKLTRRELLMGLAAIGLSPMVAGQQQAGVVRAYSLDHVSLQVADPARTEAFYRKLFGFPPSRPIPSTGRIPGFDLPGSYITFQQSETPGRIDHFCLAVDGPYDIPKVAEEMTAAGFETSSAGNATTGFIIDPDGIRIQFWPTKDRLSNLPFPSG